MAYSDDLGTAAEKAHIGPALQPFPDLGQVLGFDFKTEKLGRGTQLEFLGVAAELRLETNARDADLSLPPDRMGRPKVKVSGSRNQMRYLLPDAKCGGQPELYPGSCCGWGGPCSVASII